MKYPDPPLPHPTKGGGFRWTTALVLSLAIPALGLGCSADLSDVKDDSEGTGASNGSGSKNGGSVGGTEAGNTGGGGRGNGSGSTPGAGGTSSGSTGSGGMAVPPVTLQGGVKLDGSPVKYRVVRLTHEQWDNSVRDVLLLAENPQLSGSFIPDAPNGKFSNNEKSLEINQTLRTDYLRITEGLAKTVSNDASALGTLGADSSSVISSVGRRAFRRALTSEEQASYEDLWDEGPTFFGSGDDFADGARVFFEALFQSPKFLYRLELTPAGQRLSGAELATKLSFLLLNTTPDEDLLAAAEAGELDTDAGLVAAASAMMDEAGAAMGIYHDELYGLHRYSQIEKNTMKFRNYSNELNSVLMEADLMFFDRVFDSGQGLRAILESNIAFVNQDTAAFYGETASGSELKEIELGDDRPGFLTRTGFLAYNATGSLTDPIHRGVDVSRKVLCVDIPAPPPEVPELPTIEPGQTNRERVAMHTSVEPCKTCHQRFINPLGFAFEAFDAVGQIQEEDGGQPVDTSSTYEFSGGEQEFADAAGLISIIADGEQAHGCYSANLAEFVLARDVAGGEEELVTEMLTESVDSDASIQSLILEVIQDPLFTTAQGGAQ